MIGGASISSRDLLAPLSTPPDISENLYYTKPRIRDVIRMAHNRADPTLPLDALRFLFFLALDPRSSFHPDAFVTRFTRAALLVYVIPARPLRRIENQFLAAVREAEEGDGFEARERYIRTWKADEDGIYHEQRGDEKEVAECLEEVAEVLERAEARDDLEGGETGEPGEGEDEDRDEDMEDEEEVRIMEEEDLEGEMDAFPPRRFFDLVMREIREDIRRGNVRRLRDFGVAYEVPSVDEEEMEEADSVIEW